MRQISLFLGLALLIDVGLAGSAQKWGPRNLKSLVTFGDSYTDDSRLNYITEHKGEAPPAGWVQPVVRNPIQQKRERKTSFTNSMLWKEQPIRLRRLQLGLLCRAKGKRQPLQLRRQRRSLLEQDHPPHICRHRRPLPLGTRV